jgi:hypothetical protein
LKPNGSKIADVNFSTVFSLQGLDVFTHVDIVDNIIGFKPITPGLSGSPLRYQKHSK